MISLPPCLRRSIANVIVLSLLASVALAAPSTVLWNFTTASPTSGLPASLSGGAVAQGNNNSSTTMLTSSSVSSGYTDVSGGNNAGIAARSGALNQATGGSAYFEFTLTPTAGGQIQASAISFGSRSTGTGPQAFGVYTSVDNYATAVATGTLSNNSTWVRITPTFTTITGADNAAVTFRIYGYNATGGTAVNWRIDDLQLTVDVLGGGPTPPAVFSVSPANAATLRAMTSLITVTFNQPVTTTGAWFTITGSTTGAHTAAVSGGPTTFTLTPDVPFANGETVTLNLIAAQITDQSSGTLNMGADFTSSFTIIPAVSGTPVAIHTIQGSGTSSTYATQSQSVSGVVTATFQATGGIGGYYLQAPDAEWDADDTTSEGIYVFDNSNVVAVGERIAVTGTVTEYASSGVTETEIATVTAFSKLSSGNPLPSPVNVTLPFASATHAERYEGMRVTLPQTLTVTNNYDYGRYGELTLSTRRQSTPTNVVAPGAPALALAAQNALDRIMLDDALSTVYPDPTPWLSGSDPATASRRTGSTTTGVAGVLAHKFGGYLVEVTAAPTFVETNPRSGPSERSGALRVVAGNVENLMNGDGAGGGFPTSRGASTYAEYQRQLAKVTAGILALAPDIMGISEVENDRITNSAPHSYGPTSAIAQLVANLNANAPAGTTYAFVDASAVDIVTDLVRSAIIYRVETVEPVGGAVMLSNPYFNNHARNPLAQTFREKATGEKFTFCINHFRAKASASSMDDGTGLNADQGDGQETNNYLRTKEAEALTAWLATDPSGSGDPDFLIMGDLNANAKEDPITAIVNAGYVNLVEHYEGEGGYSYQFGGEFGHLDHALATQTLAGQVSNTVTWHVNADEPVYYDYNVENKSVTQQAINAGTGYRFADHDPVIVDLNLVPELTPQQSWRLAHFDSIDNAGDAADMADPDGDGLANLIEYALDLDPTAPSAPGLPQASAAGDNWIYTYSRPMSRTDVTLVVEVSTDLSSWTTDGVTHGPLTQEGASVTYQATYPRSATEKVFFRLSVTTP